MASDVHPPLPTRTDLWFKSSFSGDSACCVEVKLGHEILVRDSKYQRNLANDLNNQPILQFTPNEWAAFVAGVKAGEFDL